MVLNRETLIKLLQLNQQEVNKFISDNSGLITAPLIEILKFYCLYMGKEESKVEKLIKTLVIFPTYLPSMCNIAKDYLMTIYNINTLYKNNNPILYY